MHLSSKAALVYVMVLSFLCTEVFIFSSLQACISCYRYSSHHSGSCGLCSLAYTLLNFFVPSSIQNQVSCVATLMIIFVVSRLINPLWLRPAFSMKCTCVDLNPCTSQHKGTRHLPTRAYSPNIKLCTLP